MLKNTSCPAAASICPKGCLGLKFSYNIKKVPNYCIYFNRWGNEIAPNSPLVLVPDVDNDHQSILYCSFRITPEAKRNLVENVLTRFSDHSVKISSSRRRMCLGLTSNSANEQSQATIIQMDQNPTHAGIASSGE